MSKKGIKIMKIEMDKIQFESRDEIGKIANVLEIFLKEHKNSREVNCVKDCIDKLDAMYMSW